MDNSIDVFKIFTNTFRNGVRLERTKLSSFKDKFFIELEVPGKINELIKRLYCIYILHTNIQKKIIFNYENFEVIAKDDIYMGL